MTKLTQEQCRVLFLEMCREIKIKIDTIDKETPFSTVPPSWWLDMMDLKNSIIKITEES